MGQKRPVQAFLLVTEETLEEKLLNTLSAKHELAMAALDPDSKVKAVETLPAAWKSSGVALGLKEPLKSWRGRNVSCLQSLDTFPDKVVFKPISEKRPERLSIEAKRVPAVL